MYAEMLTVNVRNEEREEYLDTFSTCETCLREEMALANQAFDDLGRYCPSDLDTCEPLEMAGADEERANCRFWSLLGTLGISSPADLAEATNAELEVCEEVYSNPLRCGGKQRAAVLAALEQSPQLNVWNVPHPLNRQSVGRNLAEWTRENFKTPWQFRRRALECELKCYLLGIVDSLKDSEIEDLISATSLHNAMKAAAAEARRAGRRDAYAAQAFENFLVGLEQGQGNTSE